MKKHKIWVADILKRVKKQIKKALYDICLEEQQFYQNFEIRLYHDMSHNKVRDLERDLLGSLLDETEQSEKMAKDLEQPKRVQAFSAPPAFLDFDFKMSFQALDEYSFDSPDPEDHSITKAFCSKQQTFEPFPAHSGFRKLSCDSALLSYYENSTPTNFDYFQYTAMLTPEQQLLNNLSKASQWARDQNGSRAVQNIFEGENLQHKDDVFNYLINDTKSLIKDRFGNYVFQKIFEKGTQEHKQILLNQLWKEIYDLSLHNYGCRVIQKAIQFIGGKTSKQQQFMQEIKQNILILMQNQNGNHVIQKCIQIFPHKSIESFADIIIVKLHQLPYHTYGCRVVQKYLQNHRGQQKCEYILQQLLKNVVPLSQCQFGNYVMQYIVTKCQQERKFVYTIFLSQIVDLSVNKYASNVVQKAIQAAGSNFCQLLADLFITNQKDLVMLSKHQFGNYVIQSMFDKVCKEKKAQIKTILKQSAAEISKSQYGRHVLMQLQKTRNK